MRVLSCVFLFAGFLALLPNLSATRPDVCGDLTGSCTPLSTPCPGGKFLPNVCIEGDDWGCCVIKNQSQSAACDAAGGWCTTAADCTAPHHHKTHIEHGKCAGGNDWVCCVLNDSPRFSANSVGDDITASEYAPTTSHSHRRETRKFSVTVDIE